MKTLKTILASAIISSTLLLSGEEQPLKEETKKILKATFYNLVRKEKELPTFEVKGKEIDYYKSENDSLKIEYQTKLNGKTIYFSISPEKKNKKETPEFNNYLRIKESTKLLVLYDKNSKIENIRQQGRFIRQDPWKKEKINLEIKGLEEVEKHEETEIIFENSEKILEYLVSKVPFNFQEKYNQFIAYSKEKEKKKIESLLVNFKDELNFDLIPLYIPDKIFGQKMIAIDYEINFEKRPKKIMFYAMLNLE